MIEYLKQVDHRLFYLVNHDMGNSFFDWLMPYMHNKYTWIPLYVCLIVFFVYRYKKVGIYLVVLLALAVAASDGSCNLIKHVVKRLRPCNSPYMAGTVTVRVPGSGYGFPSSHAENHFTFAVFLGIVFYTRNKWLWVPFVLWAAFICLAQVYVGLHYPSDIFIGALLGCLMGVSFAYVFKQLQPRFFSNTLTTA